MTEVDKPSQWDLLKANFDTIDTMINEKK